ncbi:MAG: hypothetical protein B6I38_11695 [Anaerolineaceae bacterium 4572_5.1]|nr:MAG: hypothetical protein B6I38_11695 [Anaerolineaceae bacterium 4572_5.1]
MIESPIERLLKTNPDMEIWWDSSPLVFEAWVQKMLNEAASDQRSAFSLQAVESDPEFWNGWIDDLIRSHPDASRKELFWMTYKEVVKRGAEMYMPIFEASQGRFGWISGQLDPRLFTETEQMITDAEELSALSPNVMIKVPASMEGIEVVKVLTSKAIATNTTVCFTLPQIMASANAAMEGVKIAQENGVDLSRWRAVITHMIGRLTERPVLDVQAERRGLKISRREKHWLGMAVFRRAYRLLNEGGYVSKMLACSMRNGPLVAGKMRFWDVQKLAGGDIIYTMPPYVLEPLFEFGNDMIFQSEIDNDDVPQEVMDKLLKIPYCVQAYDPNGLALEQFNDHPATLYTVKGFSEAAAGLEEYVGQRM